MRRRITALATVLVAVVLGAGALALIAVQRQQITSNLDASLEQRADTYEAALEGDDGFELGNTTDDDRAVQLVAADGRVVASTPNLAGTGPVGAELDQGPDQVIETKVIPELEDDGYRVLSRRVSGRVERGAAQVLDLHVAQNIDDAEDTIRRLAIALAVAVPTVVALLAVMTWWLVGRTLRPVEMIRAEVAEISGTDLHRRVPVSEHGDEISRLAQTMNSMLDRVERASIRQRQFVADASHELRTPLTRIRTEVEVDLSHPERADPAATNQTVLEEAIGLQRLLDDLLFLARSDEGQLPVNHWMIDLDDIVHRQVRLLRDETENPQARRTGSDISIDTSGVRAVVVEGDANQLGRMVGNLLNNALCYAESRISVTLTDTAGSAVLSITDDGPGVAAEVRERIFERFGRADEARTRNSGGVGLGLAIVSDIVTRHGGTVRYDDGWGDGARFVVELPTPGPTSD